MAKTKATLGWEDLTTAELKRELKAREKPEFYDYADKQFVKQYEFIRDPSRFKLALCTRRAGKTEGACLDLIEASANVPGSVNIFFGRTRQSAKNTAWRILLRRIEKLGLETSTNKTELSVTFANGSIIFLAGVDATADERDKYRGMPLYRVYIDECASHRQDLYELVVAVLMPALVDLDGTLGLLGTAGNFTQGMFYRLSARRPPDPDHPDPPCSIHQWTAFDNPFIAKNWAAAIEKIRLERPAFMETPMYAQEYLGKWVVDDVKRIYNFSYDRNTFEMLPLDKKWTIVLGVDLGFEDDTALVVIAFSKEDPKLYVLDSYKEKKLDITAAVQKIRIFIDKYHPDVCVVDGSSKQAVQEMIKRHGLELIASDKKDKAHFLAIVSAEMGQGLIKVHKKRCIPLYEEMEGLIWAEPKLGQVIRKEHPGCPNHLCDAFYYAWRYSYSYLGHNPAAPVAPGSAEWAKKEALSLLDSAKARFHKEEAIKAAEDWGVSLPGGDWQPYLDG